MIVAAIVWLLGFACALAVFAFTNHSAEAADGRFSGVEIGWLSLLWPLTVLVIVAVSAHVHWQRRGA
jgi:hypothetical protein